MTDDRSAEIPAISPDMTILDVVSKYRSTETVFKQYDEPAGVCLCCQALFEPLTGVFPEQRFELLSACYRVRLHLA